LGARRRALQPEPVTRIQCHELASSQPDDLRPLHLGPIDPANARARIARARRQRRQAAGTHSHTPGPAAKRVGPRPGEIFREHHDRHVTVILGMVPNPADSSFFHHRVKEPNQWVCGLRVFLYIDPHSLSSGPGPETPFQTVLSPLLCESSHRHLRNYIMI
jgi:hypothetical protein